MTVVELELPEEIWGFIMERGVAGSLFTHRELCSLAIVSRSFRRLSSHDSLWSHLLPPPHPHPLPPPPPLKLLYQSRFEKDKARRVSAHRRAVLSLESEIAVRSMLLRNLRRLLTEEHRNLNAATAQSADFQRARQASVALNVWQPQVIRSRQKQFVEQCAVPVDARLKDLDMNIKVCRKQIEVSSKAYSEEKTRIDACKKRLESMKYHPLSHINPHRDITKSDKHKKLKTSGIFPCFSIALAYDRPCLCDEESTL